MKIHFYKIAPIILAYAIIFPSISQAQNSALSESKLADYTISSVFQVITTIEANIEYPSYAFDKQSLEIYTNYNIQSILKYDPKKIISTGSAFSINEDGYLITNAHVLEVKDPDYTIRYNALSELTNEIINYIASTYNLSDDDWWTVDYNIYNWLNENLEVKDYKINYFIIPPSVSSLSWQESGTNFNEYWPAELLIKGNTYPGIDIAIIKINQGKIPSLNISDQLPKIGEKVFAVGFPAAASLTSDISNQASFTSGVISAIRYSDNKDFKVVQTDTSIGSGSSGGPVLNDMGEVIGITTLKTGYYEPGGNFNYFLPISLADKFLNRIDVKKNENKAISSVYRLMVDLIEQGKCEEAKIKIFGFFQKNYESLFIKDLLENCLSKNNIPTPLQQSSFPIIYIVIGGVFLFTGIILGGLIIFVFYKIKRGKNKNQSQDIIK